MTLMEKQDLMTANPARFTYRATFGAEWCLCCQFGFCSAVPCSSTSHTSLNQGFLWSKSSASLARETQEQVRGESECRSRHLFLEDGQDAPLLPHEQIPPRVDGFINHPSSCFPFWLLEKATWGEMKVSFPNPQVQGGMSTA